MSDEPDSSDWLPKNIAERARWLPAAGERPEGMYVHFGGAVGRTVASLRISGKEMEPDDVTRLLQCQPDYVHRTGDPVTSDDRGRRHQGMWNLKSALPDSASLDDHITHLLDRVTDDLEVWCSLAPFHPNVFCGLFLSGLNQGDEISPRVAGLLASRGVALGLDIYSESQVGS